MILDLLIKINKNKLNKMIERNINYEVILKQSQKLDTYITEKTIKLINKSKKAPKKDVPI
ncbi:MAG: Spo0E family sporulation regulatory protein-aspartic acid phosphatase [Clostridia bacterium]|nr:Spo0E family sporulation regulatory protein-aspartic acid phosphatase [Clostridia bacterium]